MAGELEHADKMRRDMIANVSHELRTPVSALQAMVENMADGVTEPTPTNLESILTQTQRLSDLIAFLLDLSRMEAGAASLNIEKFNFADFLDETIEPLEIADGGHAHDIRVTVPADITMEGDQDRLRQLFTNIIANALKHSADGTTVLVDAHEDENQGTIVTNVVNFGSQIAPSDRLDIFRRLSKARRVPAPSRAAPVLACPSRAGRPNCTVAPSKWSTTREVPISKSSCLNITSPNADIVRRPTVYCIRTDVRIQGGRRSMTQQSESQAMAHEATLFVMQMAGDSMINAGIHNGDLLIVDRSLAPVPGDVVAAVMDDEIAIKRLVSRAGITILHAENPRYPDYMPSNGASPAIWGIVTDVIHPLISSSDRRTTHRQYQHAHHLGAGLLKRLNALPHSGTCGDDIINEKHRVAIADEITLHPDMTGDTTGTLCRRDLLHGSVPWWEELRQLHGRASTPYPRNAPAHRFGQRCRMGTSSSAH